MLGTQPPPGRGCAAIIQWRWPGRRDGACEALCRTANLDCTIWTVRFDRKGGCSPAKAGTLAEQPIKRQSEVKKKHATVAFCADFACAARRKVIRGGAAGFAHSSGKRETLSLLVGWGVGSRSATYRAGIWVLALISWSGSVYETG